MEPDLLAAADDHPDVRLARIDATAQPEVASSLQVRGTPTILGFLDGEEVFRHTGRLGRTELDQLFDSLGGGGAPPTGATDGWIRVAAGLALAAVALLVDPAWPWLVGGLGVTVWGATSLLQRGR